MIWWGKRGMVEYYFVFWGDLCQLLWMEGIRDGKLDNIKKIYARNEMKQDNG